MRIALGVCYRGGAYHGWQSQPGGLTVQDRLETALARFLDVPREAVRTVCAGRTDAGVHALNQVVHLDCDAVREPFSWVRGSNRFLPDDIAVQWAVPVDEASFHARNAARGRRYRYLLIESPARPGLASGLAGWTHRPLDEVALREACAVLVGEHDFSAFRSAECQAASPVKTLHSIEVDRRGACWRFDFHATAFLHHMARNLMVAGGGRRRPRRRRAGGRMRAASRRRETRRADVLGGDGLYPVGVPATMLYGSAFAGRCRGNGWLGLSVARGRNCPRPASG